MLEPTDESRVEELEELLRAKTSECQQLRGMHDAALASLARQMEQTKQLTEDLRSKDNVLCDAALSQNELEEKLAVLTKLLAQKERELAVVFAEHETESPNAAHMAHARERLRRKQLEVF